MTDLKNALPRFSEPSREQFALSPDADDAAVNVVLMRTVSEEGSLAEEGAQRLAAARS